MKTGYRDAVGIIYEGDATAVLRGLPAGLARMCVTSPPYWGLRDYGIAGQLGLEDTPEEYVQKLADIFDDVKRVLSHDATLWLNIGDSYAAQAKKRTEAQATAASTLQGRHATRNQKSILHQQNKKVSGLKLKDLVGVPWMVAFELRRRGWFLRSDIIWHKPNPMPESVTDRPTKAHEYIFLFSKSESYYYDADAIKTESKDASDDRRRREDGRSRKPDKMRNGIRPQVPSGWDTGPGHHHGLEGYYGSGNKERKPRPGVPDGTGKNQAGSVPWKGTKANKRDVWTVTTKPFKDGHFATFPPKLIEPCILAGSAPGHVVLDPFMGAGTTALVARQLGRRYVGAELSAEYLEIIRKRMEIK